jgi:hypothetical protein
MRAGTIDVRLRLSAGSQNVDEAAIEEMMRTGPIHQDIQRRANNVADYMRANCPVKTGKLLGTIRTEDAGVSVDATAGRAGETPYLGYQMYGTSPHEIRARGGGMLSFYWEKHGVQFVGRRVNHPGNRATRFVQDSVQAAAD